LFWLFGAPRAGAAQGGGEGSPLGIVLIDIPRCHCHMEMDKRLSSERSDGPQGWLIHLWGKKSYTISCSQLDGVRQGGRSLWKAECRGAHHCHGGVMCALGAVI
jgi:hypothetical protein